MKDKIGSKALAEFTVTFEISWICFQIFGRSKLCRVYKIGYDNDIIFLRGTV